MEVPDVIITHTRTIQYCDLVLEKMWDLVLRLFIFYLKTELPT